MKKRTLLFSLIGLVVIAIIGTSTIFKRSKKEVVLQVSQQTPSGMKIDLSSIAPPNTDQLSAQPDFDIFAWNSFIALNWPAVEPTASNGYLRGIPDVTKSFREAKSGDLLVWETFKEKREIFNQVKITPTDTVPYLYPWNYEPDYGPLIPATVDIDPNAPIEKHPKILQGRKQMTPYNAFDETAEVGSEALEVYYPAQAYKDSINPIFGQPVGPRVWKGNPSDSIPVLYEVKLNYDYYNYIKANNLYSGDTSIIGAAARKAELRLPYRTSSEFGPKSQKGGPNYQLAINYNQVNVANQYAQIKNGTQTPPLIGSMQFKAAWVMLTDADDTTKYHTSEALYYVTNKEGDPVPLKAKFGLIGLHIIQRIHITNKEADSNPIGGTFIFATWEHTSIRDNIKDGLTQFTYSNYYNPEVDPGAIKNPDGSYKYPQGFYPPIDPSKPYEGVYPVPEKFKILSNPGGPSPATREVNDMVHTALPQGSVWRNYQLVGTQFIAIDVNSASILEAAGKSSRYPVTQNDPQGIGLPVYLANLVIETNEGLQFFQGQPPGTLTIPNYQGAGVGVNATTSFLRDNANTSFNRVAYNMGGCMGCHGVAQSRGYSFSFVLLGGRDGAKTDTETQFEIPPLTPVNSDGN